MSDTNERMRTTISQHELIRIANWQTTLERDELKEALESGCSGVHESVLRAYQILRKVKILLELGTPSPVIIELIALMESDDCQPYGWHEARAKKSRVEGLV
jgi:hypothetical protein